MIYLNEFNENEFSSSNKDAFNKKENIEKVDLKTIFHGKNMENKLNQSFLDSKLNSSSPKSLNSSFNPIMFKSNRPVVHKNQRNTILRRRLERFNLRNSEARRSIGQTVKEANKTNFEFLKRTNRLVAKCKLILLKIAYSAYVKLKSSKKKILLLQPGVQKNSGTIFEQKIVSAVTKRLNNNAVVFETLKLDFKSSLMRQPKRNINRSKMSINFSGDRNSFFKQIKSRNLKQEARN